MYHNNTRTYKVCEASHGANNRRSNKRISTSALAVTDLVTSAWNIFGLLYMNKETSYHISLFKDSHHRHSYKMGMLRVSKPRNACRDEFCHLKDSILLSQRKTFHSYIIGHNLFSRNEVFILAELMLSYDTA